MVLRHVFLDFGNTLVHEEPSRFEIYAQAAREHGARIEESVMRGLMVRVHGEMPAEVDGAWRYTDPWFRGYIRRIFGDELGIDPGSGSPTDPSGGWDTFQQRLFARFSDPHTFRTFPGVADLLAALGGAGLGVGVISNWSPRLPGLIRGLGLAEAFDPVVCSAIERVEKPSPEIFRLALDRAGVRAEDCLHAGDHPDKDCRAASEVGLATVLVDHADEQHSTTRVRHRVTSLAQLKDHILDLTT